MFMRASRAALPPPLLLWSVAEGDVVLALIFTEKKRKTVIKGESQKKKVKETVVYNA